MDRVLVHTPDIAASMGVLGKHRVQLVPIPNLISQT